MPIPESLALVPDVQFGGQDAARILWDSRPGFETEWGMLCWKGRRFWFTMVTYDQEEEQIWYSVSPLSDEQARVLDDWHVLWRSLSTHWQVLANDPVTAGGLTQEEKGRQVGAIMDVRPKFVGLPIEGRFTVSDHGSSKERNA